ncbi:uncharacterized protein F4822DRAFT_441800 [Hypoxylon trugodes]|uniref:uncharacterized protein n=1 Tax=Hypoxylon trugodes TaxID=326681 RepID=UPI00218EFF68|nr:uncharacterized protein F4822DRAFT_441800 [Hypoxylon trugodes]KAI1382575.1 hypothetical protein F4822DRAFT_441800 [Hypoxylon trugodes]
MATDHRLTRFPGGGPCVDPLQPPAAPSSDPKGFPPPTTQKARVDHKGGGGAPSLKADTLGLLRKKRHPGDSPAAPPPKHLKRSARVGNVIPELPEQPEEWYKKIGELTLGVERRITVLDYKKITSKGKDSGLFMMKDFASGDQIDAIRKIKHPHFLAVQEVFLIENRYSVVFQYMPLSLLELRLPFLNENDLTAIIGQILDGLSYLEKAGLKHGQLTCSNILVDFDGTVKIWGCEESHATSDSKRDIRDLGNVIMELMQGYPKDDGAVGIEDLERWPADSRAVEFLSATTWASKISELANLPLLQQDWHPSWLKGIVCRANFLVRRAYGDAGATETQGLELSRPTQASLLRHMT